MMFGKKDQGVDLAAFVGGIVRALTKAQQALPYARMKQIEKHFDKDEEGVYHPKMIPVQVNEHEVVNVPQYALAKVNNIGIETAIIKCSAKIVAVENEEIDCELTDTKSRVRYYVKPSDPLNKSFEIEIKFSKRTDCEAEELLMEKI